MSSDAYSSDSLTFLYPLLPGVSIKIFEKHLIYEFLCLLLYKHDDTITMLEHGVCGKYNVTGTWSLTYV